MGKKISQYTEVATNPADNDEFLLELASSGAYRRVKYSNLKPSGSLVQEVGNVTTAVATGSTTVPLDDTIPQNTEGDEYMTQAITPKNASNILEIEVNVMVALSAANTAIMALFQDSTANALNAIASRIDTNNTVVNMKLVHRMAAGTTSSTTFKVRIGPNTAATTTFNGASSARLFGAIGKSSIIIREFKA